MMSSEISFPLALLPRVQNYAWGKPAFESIIPSFISEAIDPNALCAELWVGAHKNAPSLVRDKKVALNLLISEFPEQILGKKVVEKLGKELPFLFKILSISQPLSIQLHPDKQQAELLHANDPKNYPDKNHKPEVAIALSQVQLLYGFRTLDEIKKDIECVPELAEALGGQANPFFLFAEEEPAKIIKESLKRLFLLESVRVKELTQCLYERLTRKSECTIHESWIKKLSLLYPDGDVGVLSLFLQNIEILNPGEALFIEPNIPHAYLSGELVECMANSDNVVRSGLTPKYRDVKTLLEIANYSAQKKQRVETSQIKNALQYVIPVEDFTLQKLSSGTYSVGHAELSEESFVELLFCLSGNGALVVGEREYKLEKGSSFLLPACMLAGTIKLEDGEIFRVGVVL
jgi:mannose-6-phosphate isomerase